MTISTELTFRSARDLAAAIRQRELSAVEVVTAHLEAVERVDPAVNAMVTVIAEAALAEAAEADAALARGDDVGPLHGLPVAHKDFTQTAGVRTTLGSPLFADWIPDVDALPVERLKRAGAISIGKTNTPEFAAGSQTYNEVFGATLNPYDTSRTCGGSSGGSAVALACGMVPLADGTDMGGSLRNPASYCNVVGLRPSPGRVPAWPSPIPWHPFIVSGPMARTAADVALMLSAMAGPDDRSPVALTEPGDRFAGPLDRDFSGVRVAWSRDLGGLPVDPAVTAVLDAHRDVFASLGCEVADGEPDFTDADMVFKTWRAWIFELLLGEQLDRNRDRLGEDVIWNIEQGRALTGPQLGVAEKAHTGLYHRVREFMAEHEFLLAPVVQLPPFDVTQPYPREIAGEAMETYIDWMKSCYFISAVGLPAASVPCGFTADGLPIGLQIIGRHRDDLGVLQLAHEFEQATLHHRRRPPVVA
ncbi:MAG: amidase [Solirubrobacteraceae bacterium]|nr:amidase [Solirubrobacteraceae bacterium]